eukprot:TRINITY_DN2205_c0_g1_i1.p1 TRINITY_DN2205_c0_g1~~TRINITY_DN2205_c0_g1_i1.p1  ORF type:complete len:627 (+),score=127.40 TRINITY_DN2205_c0_g1_i1:148-1881(+)
MRYSPVAVDIEAGLVHCPLSTCTGTGWMQSEEGVRVSLHSLLDPSPSTSYSPPPPFSLFDDHTSGGEKDVWDGGRGSGGRFGRVGEWGGHRDFGRGSGGRGGEGTFEGMGLRGMGMEWGGRGGRESWEKFTREEKVGGGGERRGGKGSSGGGGEGEGQSLSLFSLRIENESLVSGKGHFQGRDSSSENMGVFDFVVGECIDKVNECLIGTHNCSPDVDCVDTPEGYECGPCPPHTVKIGNDCVDSLSQQHTPFPTPIAKRPPLREATPLPTPTSPSAPSTRPTYSRPSPPYPTPLPTYSPPATERPLSAPSPALQPRPLAPPPPRSPSLLVTAVCLLSTAPPPFPPPTRFADPSSTSSPSRNWVAFHVTPSPNLSSEMVIPPGSRNRIITATQIGKKERRFAVIPPSLPTLFPPGVPVVYFHQLAPRTTSLQWELQSSTNDYSSTTVFPSQLKVCEVSLYDPLTLPVGFSERIAAGGSNTGDGYWTSSRVYTFTVFLGIAAAATLAVMTSIFRSQVCRWGWKSESKTRGQEKYFLPQEAPDTPEIVRHARNHRPLRFRISRGGSRSPSPSRKRVFSL